MKNISILLRAFSKSNNNVGEIRSSKNQIKNVNKDYLVQIFQADKYQGWRLDKFLKEKYKMSWSVAQILLRKKRIFIVQNDIEDNQDTLDTAKGSKTKLKGKDYQIIPGDYLIAKKDVLPMLDQGISHMSVPTVNYTDEFLKQILTLCKHIILYVDKNFVFVNKLSGLSSHGGTKVRLNQLHFIKTYLYIANNKNEADKYGIPEEHRPNYSDVVQDQTDNVNYIEDESSNAYVIHRLDKPVTGILAYARNYETASYMGEKFRSHYEIKKAYVAIHYGLPTHIHNLLDKFQEGNLDITNDIKSLFYGNIDVPITFNEDRKRAEILNVNKSNNVTVKQSITNFFIPIILINRSSKKFYIDLTDESQIEKNLTQLCGLRTDNTLNKNEIFTVSCQELIHGRKHQLRAHASVIHQSPILFDYKYNFTRNEQLSDDQQTSEKINLDQFEYVKRIKKSKYQGPIFDSYEENMIQSEKDLYNSPEESLLKQLVVNGFLGKLRDSDKISVQNSGIMLHSYKMKFLYNQTQKTTESPSNENKSKKFIVHANLPFHFEEFLKMYGDFQSMNEILQNSISEYFF